MTVIPVGLADRGRNVRDTAFEDFVAEEVHKGRSTFGLYPAADEQTLKGFYGLAEGAGEVIAHDMCCEGEDRMRGQLIALFVRRRLVRPGLFVCLACMVSMLASCACLSQELPSRTDAGALLFNNACRTCHTIREGDNRFGPTLYKIIGRKAGSLPNYNYSSAMKDAGFVWDEEKLDRFIAHPDEVVPENNMRPYGGLASADDRAKIIAYLRSMTTDRP